MSLGNDLDRQRYERVFENLAKEDGLMDENGNFKQAPHCDALILHAPGTCSYCDRYPDRQNARINRRVAFTGEGYHPTKTRCPSEYFRSVEDIYKWERNRPSVEPFEGNMEEEVVVVDAVPFDDKTENKLEFSQIVSVLANVTANLRALSNDSDSLRTIENAESSLSNGEALLEILRSDIHPPIFFEPSPTETSQISYDPAIHDLSMDYIGNKILAYVRPKAVKGNE